MIQQNIPLKLATSVLSYKITQAVLSAIFLSVVIQFFPQTASYRVEAIIGVFIVGIVYAYLYWMFFSYQISQTSIVIRSGVIFRSAKTVEFNNLQNASADRGPLLMLFGLSRFNGFTASVGQISFSSSTHTDAQGRTTSSSSSTTRPDVDIILPKADAEEMLTWVQSGHIQRVQNTPAA